MSNHSVAKSQILKSKKGCQFGS